MGGAHRVTDPMGGTKLLTEELSPKNGFSLLDIVN